MISVLKESFSNVAVPTDLMKSHSRNQMCDFLLKESFCTQLCIKLTGLLFKLFGIQIIFPVSPLDLRWGTNSRKCLSTVY